MTSVKSISKKAVSLPVVRAAITWLAAAYIKLLWWTGRWTVIGAEHRDQALANKNGFVACFWHGRLLMIPNLLPKDRDASMMISAHRDGEWIARIVKWLRIDWIKGSTTRGGAAALREAVTEIQAGKIVGITPDGPRGPRMRLTEGVIQLARLSGAPIVPVTFGVQRGKIFRSWDRFLLPHPFTRGCIVFGAPIFVQKELNEEQTEILRIEVEAAMNALVKSADEATGRDPILPAEPEGTSVP